MTVFLLHILIITGIYALVVLGLQISIGRGRVLLIAPTIFFAIGAYSYAILTTTLQWHPLLSAPLASLLGGCAGYITSFLSMRLKGDHLVLASLGLCEITRSVLNNWDALTNGSIGMMNIPSLFNTTSRYQELWLFFTTAAIFVLLTFVFSNWLSRQPFGLVHASLDGDEPGVEAIGKRVGGAKRAGIAIGGFIAGIAGVLFAAYTSYIDPTTFTVGESIMIFAMLAIGGLGSPFGAILGASLFVLLPELLRFLGLPDHVADPTRRMICGAMLLLVMRFRPNGIISTAIFNYRK